MFAIFKKEFKRLFFTPSFYLSVMFLHFMNLMYFSESFFTWNYGVRSTICVFVVGFGAGLISKELRDKTYKLLFSAPVKISSIVFGKYLALFSVMFILAGVLFLINFSVNIFFGATFLLRDVFFSLLSVGFYIALFSAVALFFSTLTKNVGFVCTILYSGYFLTTLGFMYLNRVSFRSNWYLQIYSLIFEYAKPADKLFLSIFSLESVGYFVVLICACLILSIKFLENKR